MAKGRKRKGHGRQIDLTRTRRRTPRKTDARAAERAFLENDQPSAALTILELLDDDRSSKLDET